MDKIGFFNNFDDQEIKNEEKIIDQALGILKHEKELLESKNEAVKSAMKKIDSMKKLLEDIIHMRKKFSKQENDGAGQRLLEAVNQRIEGTKMEFQQLSMSAEQDLVIFSQASKITIQEIEKLRVTIEELNKHFQKMFPEKRKIGFEI